MCFLFSENFFPFPISFMSNLFAKNYKKNCNKINHAAKDPAKRGS